ncbi:alanine racemase [Anaerococcus porci]|uniref:alanine racemase n=1 Tax=Anaerococcus porci TaxID=2652269 RepID=UPI002A755611|nr:alanine racemase [Anaerococcus porci]MDY3006882.1 alanine racemase [Anaerococcus porci]
METYLEVNLSNIKYNLNAMRNLDKDAMFCAVLKADAYGLGAVKIAKEIEGDIDYIAVARLSEAIELRENSIDTPILILGYVPVENIEKCIKYNIDIAIYDLDLAKAINSCIDNKIKGHLALDTGHSRIGFRDFEIDKIKELKKLDNIDIISAFSHFSTADEEDKSYTKFQYETFNKIIDKVKNDFDFKFVHISNDASAIAHNITKDMVRSGISLFGIYPSDYMRELNQIEIKKTFELYSSVSFIKEVKKGTYISYGRTFKAPKNMKIATISIGYADGYFRKFSNCGTMIINGKPCQVVGRVCMDQVMVDITGLDCKVGDKVIVYSDIYEEANKVDTIVYELMTSVSTRVPRIYKK